jgi:hypothetical protein
MSESMMPEEPRSGDMPSLSGIPERRSRILWGSVREPRTNAVIGSVAIYTYEVNHVGLTTCLSLPVFV